MKPFTSLRYLERLLGVPRERLRELAQAGPREYRPFVQLVKPGKPRRIDRPSDELRDVQRKLLDGLLYPRTSLPAEFCGAVPGRTTVDGARPHRGQIEVVRLDISGFFESVSHNLVHQALRAHCRLAGEVLSLVTGITTVNGSLPQGSPTSPHLANLVLIDFHEGFSEHCEQAGLRFSLFIDDVAISGPAARDAIPVAVELLRRMGLSAARRKQSITRRGQRQEVLGIAVGSDLRAAKKHREAARKAAVEALKRGSISARGFAQLRGRIQNIARVSQHDAVGLNTLLTLCEPLVLEPSTTDDRRRAPLSNSAPRRRRREQVIATRRWKNRKSKPAH